MTVRSPTTFPPDPELPAPDSARVEEVLRALAAALRSYRLYEEGNPMRERFIATLREKLGGLWDDLPLLRLEIGEGSIRWEDRTVYPAGTAADLPFLIYKDGIRELTMLPGFEEREVLSFLGVLARAPSVRTDEDDLTTLLWQEDLTRLRYRAVETGDGEAVPGEGGGPGAAAPIDPARVHADAEGEGARHSPGLAAEDFHETLYFLDEAEIRQLREEVRLENERDLWRDLLHALFDRLEDGAPDRQVRIVAILAELLPAALAAGSFERATSILEELVGLAGRPDGLSPSALREVRRLFEVLGDAATVAQLADILEDMPERLGDPAVDRILGYFPPSSIASLMRAAERVERPAVRRAFEMCVQRLSEGSRDEVVSLLGSEDPAVVTGALRWVGRLEIGAAVGEAERFLRHADAAVRAAAVDALFALRAAASANAIIPLLDDPDRDVRIAAAKALGALGFTGARPALEAAIGSKRMREADRTEKVACFEAFGRVAGPEGVPVLDRILNARGWLGRGEAADHRACAALALARIRHPSARAALGRAADDADPVVRSAVTRALRGELG